MLKGTTMTENGNPPVEHRKLKKWDEYKKTILRATKIYENEITKGTDPRKAELRAVKKVYPGYKNSSTSLNLWKKYSLIKTRVFAGRLPVDLLNEIHKFKGSNTYHLK